MVVFRRKFFHKFSIFRMGRRSSVELEPTSVPGADPPACLLRWLGLLKLKLASDLRTCRVSCECLSCEYFILLFSEGRTSTSVDAVPLDSQWYPSQMVEGDSRAGGSGLGRKRPRPRYSQDNASRSKLFQNDPSFERFFVGNVPGNTTVGSVRAHLVWNVEGQPSQIFVSLIVEPSIDGDGFASDPKSSLTVPSVFVAYVALPLVPKVRALGNLMFRKRPLHIAHSADVSTIAVRNFLRRESAESVSNFFCVPVESVVPMGNGKEGSWLLTNIHTFDCAVACLRKNGYHQILRSAHTGIRPIRPSIRLSVGLHVEESVEELPPSAADSVVPPQSPLAPGEADYVANGDGGYHSGHGDGGFEVDGHDVTRVCSPGLKRLSTDSAQEGLGSTGSSVAPLRLMSRSARQALTESHASAEPSGAQRQSVPGDRPLARDVEISVGVKRHVSSGGASPVPDGGRINAVSGGNDEVGYVGVVKKEPPAVVSLLENEHQGDCDAGTRDDGAHVDVTEIQAGKLGSRNSEKKWRVELSSDAGIQFVPGPSGAFCIEGKGELRYKFFG